MELCISVSAPCHTVETGVSKVSVTLIHISFTQTDPHLVLAQYVQLSELHILYPSFSTPSRLTSLMEPVDRIKLSIEFLLRVSGHFLTIGSSTDPLISVMDVHVAEGVVNVTASCTPDDALSLIQPLSHSTGVKSNLDIRLVD